MSEIEHYRGGTPATPAQVGLPPAADTDGWIRVVGDISKLAVQIAHTEFVPRAMQGKPAAVAAAMLAGREMGIGPMTALQNIHVIQGKPGQSALLMRALVLAKGHHIEYVEVTDSRAVVRGRRANEDDWTEVEFTAEQARKAKIDLGGYPQDKLVARATARLCRRKFADVISGMAYSLEELQDGDAALLETGEIGDVTPAALPAAEQAPKTAQRAPRTRKPRQTAPAAADRPAETAPASGPPLPGEEGFDEPAEDRDPNRPSTPEQNRMMHALFREAQIEERGDRLRLTGLLLNRPLDTSKGLTVTDATVVIDALVQLQSSGHDEGLAGAVTDLMNAADLRDAEQEIEQEEAEQAAADDDARHES